MLTAFNLLIEVHPKVQDYRESFCYIGYAQKRIMERISKKLVKGKEAKY
jgi:hypothetical protein